MNEGISLDELTELFKNSESPAAAGAVIDIRPEGDFKRGSFPGAFSDPVFVTDDMEIEEVKPFETMIVDFLCEKFPDICKNESDAKAFPLFIFCHTGLRSDFVANVMRFHGFNAKNVLGGWRSLVRQRLEETVAREDGLKDRTRAIEKSIIKTYHVDIWSPFIKAVKEYELVNEGDNIMVCISGGKDSFLLAKLMQELMKHHKVNFGLKFVVMDPGYNAENRKIIEDNAKLLGVPIEIFETRIFDSVANVEKNPCYLCARMRRGYLYREARKRGCNKIALGHHFDDVIETVMMGMLYAGKFETMMPKLHSNNFPGLELIRPMYMVHESAIKAWRDYNGLSFIQCACRFTENCTSCGGSRGSRRDDVKNLIAELHKTNPSVEANIFKSMENVNLKTVIAYKDNDVKHSFLERY